MKDYIQARLQEPSTYRALIWLFGAFGLFHFGAEQKESIIALCMAMAGAGGLLPDKLQQLPRYRDTDNMR